jgi:hypothetical protein
MRRLEQEWAGKALFSMLNAFDKQCDRYNTQHGQRILEPEFTELGKIWNKLVATAPLYDYIVQSE